MSMEDLRSCPHTRDTTHRHAVVATFKPAEMQHATGRARRLEAAANGDSSAVERSLHPGLIRVDDRGSRNLRIRAIIPLLRCRISPEDGQVPWAILVGCDLCMATRMTS